jgi:hypothetical protein
MKWSGISLKTMMIVVAIIAADLGFSPWPAAWSPATSSAVGRERRSARNRQPWSPDRASRERSGSAGFGRRPARAIGRLRAG